MQEDRGGDVPVLVAEKRGTEMGAVWIEGGGRGLWAASIVCIHLNASLPTPPNSILL